MIPPEIKERFEADKPALSAWGNFIRSQIELVFSGLLKMPVTYRTKAIDSLVEKALHRQKNYSDPYGDITDRVGVRVVVLLERHVSEITDWIRVQPTWASSLDRDFDSERQRDPTIFNYQSNHLILRTIGDQMIGEVPVPAGLPCEVQVRTLLQHAYSELSHDLIYKTQLLVQPAVKRLAARSMALIETADGVFLSVDNSIREQEAPARAISAAGAELLQRAGIMSWNERVNQVLLDAIRSMLVAIDVQVLKRFYAENSYLFERLDEWKDQHPVYTTPAILASIYLIDGHAADLIVAWPYTPGDLERLFVARGKSMGQI